MAAHRSSLSWPAESFGGLLILPRDWRAAILTGTAVISLVCIFILLLDAVFFRRLLTSRYVDFFTSPMWPRTAWTCLEALGDEVKFRLMVMTALVALPALIHRKSSPQWIGASIVISQFLNVWPFVLADPIYATLRYWLVGCVWGWLYWKRGWVTAASSHAVSHILLDPILLLALR